MTITDSVLDRVVRVKHSLSGEGDPASVQAVVDGPCPHCGARDVVEVHADTCSFACSGCEQVFTV